MIEQAHGLTDTALEAIAGLERRVVAADGGRLKLEWATLRRRPRDEVRDLLCWQDGQLLGFLGFYTFGHASIELTGMVDPDARRRGIGRALLAAALPLCRARGRARLLLVVPRESPGGRRFALGHGMSFDHSEHALTLRARPAVAAARPELAIRPAAAGDVDTLSRLYLDGFDDAHIDPDWLTGGRSRTLIVERAGHPIGTITITRDGRRGAIYGFVVAASERGRGIGREVLRRVCLDQFDAGADHVDLEVAVENESALGLYTSVGFERTANDDYYALRLDTAAVEP